MLGNLGMLPTAFLIAVAVGGVAYVFLFPLLSGQKRAEQRMKGYRGYRNRRPPDEKAGCRDFAPSAG